MNGEISKLLEITKRLKEKYGRNFPLDGRLVGDIGEVIVRENYNIELYPENTEKYDAYEIDTGRKIQIKSSMKKYYSFPYKETPDYYLAIKIFDDGNFKEIFNGPGKIVKDYIVRRELKDYRKSYYSLTLGVLEKLDILVNQNNKIKLINKSMEIYIFDLSSPTENGQTYQVDLKIQQQTLEDGHPSIETDTNDLDCESRDHHKNSPFVLDANNQSKRFDIEDKEICYRVDNGDWIKVQAQNPSVTILI